MTSLSSRKSWDIFALLSIEKIDFFIFSFLHIPILGVILKKLFGKGITSDLFQIFFLHSPRSFKKFSGNIILNIGLYSKNILLQSSKSAKPWPGHVESS
jgi:hypothetical protein